MRGTTAGPAKAARSAGASCMLAAFALGLTSGATPAPGAESSVTPSSPTTPNSPWGGIADLGGGGFRVTPTRIVLEGGTRSAELTLINTGSAPATYRVSLARMRMAVDGAIAEVTDVLPGEAFADSLLRFSPRQVELEPGATQTVRIQVLRPAVLADGEYRSHLVFRELPEVPDQADRPPARGVHIALQPVFGVAVPVIVRHGVTRAGVELRDLELRKDGSGHGLRLALKMMRSGNRSVYGDLTVTQSEPGGRPRVVGRMRGLAVYAPNSMRTVEIPLQLDPEFKTWRGTLRVAYEEGVEASELLAEAELALE